MPDIMTMLSNYLSGAPKPDFDAHLRQFEQDRSRRARETASYISDIIQRADRGGPQEVGQARYAQDVFYPRTTAVQDALQVGRSPVGTTFAYHPEFAEKLLELGAPLEYPFYGGAKFIVPPSAGISATGRAVNNRAAALPPVAALQLFAAQRAGNLEAGQNIDPFAQEVYGNLVMRGHPVYGPSFPSIYGPPGIVGFGRK